MRAYEYRNKDINLLKQFSLEVLALQRARVMQLNFKEMMKGIN